MLEGILVDLVPYGERFREISPRWPNSEAEFWGSAGNRHVISKATYRRHIEDWIESSGVWFGIQTKDGTPIGQVMMANVLPHHRVAMLGILIGEPDYWGGGYGTDALLLIIDYAFNWLDIRKLWLSTMSINARMSRAAQKTGFRLEACRRGQWYADGVWCDDLAYGLLREEWPGRATLIERLGLKEKPHP
jgi:RimJ/RimL family protein N-acetyltransferase